MSLRDLDIGARFDIEANQLERANRLVDQFRDRSVVAAERYEGLARTTDRGARRIVDNTQRAERSMSRLGMMGAAAGTRLRSGWQSATMALGGMTAGLDRNLLALAASTAGVTLFGRRVMNAGGELERLQIQQAALVGGRGTTAWYQLNEAIRQTNQETRNFFPAGELIRATNESLKLGASVERIVELLPAVRRSAVIFGEDMARQFQAIDDAITTGRLTSLVRQGLISPQQREDLRNLAQAETGARSLENIALERRERLILNAVIEHSTRLRDREQEMILSQSGAMKRLSGSWDDYFENVGTHLSPRLMPQLEAVSRTLDDLKDNEFAIRIASGLVTIGGAAAGVLTTLALGTRVFRFLWSGAKLFTNPLGLAVSLVGGLALAVDDVDRAWRGKGRTVTEMLANWILRGVGAKRTFRELQEGFTSWIERFPFLRGMVDGFWSALRRPDLPFQNLFSGEAGLRRLRVGWEALRLSFRGWRVPPLTGPVEQEVVKADTWLARQWLRVKGWFVPTLEEPLREETDRTQNWLGTVWLRIRNWFVSPVRVQAEERVEEAQTWLDRMWLTVRRWSVPSLLSAIQEQWNNAQEWLDRQGWRPSYRLSPSFYAPTFEDAPRHRRGTILPGYGGGDRRPAILEDGEAVVPKEAVRGGISSIVAWFRQMGAPGLQRGWLDPSGVKHFIGNKVDHYQWISQHLGRNIEWGHNPPGWIRFGRPPEQHYLKGLRDFYILANEQIPRIQWERLAAYASRAMREDRQVIVELGRGLGPTSTVGFFGRGEMAKLIKFLVKPGTSLLPAAFNLESLMEFFMFKGAEPVSLRRGGILPGYGGGDRRPAILEDGEAVVPARTVRGGMGQIVKWFRSMGVPELRRGGMVTTTPSGRGVHGTREVVVRVEIDRIIDTVTVQADTDVEAAVEQVMRLKISPKLKDLVQRILADDLRPLLLEGEV